MKNIQPVVSMKIHVEMGWVGNPSDGFQKTEKQTAESLCMFAGLYAVIFSCSGGRPSWKKIILIKCFVISAYRKLRIKNLELGSPTPHRKNSPLSFSLSYLKTSIFVHSNFFRSLRILDLSHKANNPSAIQQRILFVLFISVSWCHLWYE